MDSLTVWDSTLVTDMTELCMCISDKTVSSTSPDTVIFTQLIRSVTELKENLQSDIYTLVSFQTDLDTIASNLRQFHEGDLHLNHQIVSRINSSISKYSTVQVSQTLSDLRSKFRNIKNDLPAIVQ